MTKIIIKFLIWDDYNIEHIKKHNVTQNEVEELTKNIIVHKRAKMGRYIIFGRAGSRILSIVVRRYQAGTYYIVTARDAAKEERKKVYETEGKN